MSFDIGNTPAAPAPTVAEQKQFRSAIGIQAEPSLQAPTTAYELPAPASGEYLGQKFEYLIRPNGIAVDLTLNIAIKTPSDSGLTFPKSLTADKGYFVLLRWDGFDWCLVSLVGGF